MRKALAIALFIGAIISLILVFRGYFTRLFFAPRNTPFSATTLRNSDTDEVLVVAEELDTPWDLVFLPDQSILVSERAGVITKVSNDGTKTTVLKSNAVLETGESGLMGLALHPQFNQNHYLYVYMTTGQSGNLANKVLRYKYENGSLSDETTILDGIEGSSIHDGGRLEFGPDGFLYITTGDAGNTALAQDTTSLNGKILRIMDDGSIPDDNPFGNEVYSYGHRNPQGLAWDKQNQLWATEHGPSGIETGNDELNLINAGKNYGWPIIRGTQSLEGMETPVIESGLQDTWAPAGLAYLDDALYFGGLRGSALYEYKSNQLVEHFKNAFGRIRAVRAGPDGFLYITTSNRDGRGVVQDKDDKIIRVNPKSLK